WLESLGGGAFGAEHPIPTSAPFSVGHGDLDGDGDPDLLVGSSSGEAVWFANQAGTFGAARPVASGAGLLEDLDAADLDGDGDLDVLLAGAATYWLANDGAGAFVPVHAIDQDSSDLGATDLDGDGDADVLAAAGAG